MGQPQPSKPSGDSKKSAKHNASNSVENRILSCKNNRNAVLKLRREKPIHRPNLKFHSHLRGKSNVCCEKCGCPYDLSRVVTHIEFVPPSPRLVGIEPNPGPKGAKGRAAAKPKRVQPSKKQPQKKKVAKKVRRRKTRGLGEPRGMPGQRLERTGLLTSRNAPMLNKRMPLEEDEYIADVSGSVGFVTTSYPINPGQATVFPWGSKIAQLYEEYDFEYLEFYVTSEVSGYATQGQTGVVILSCDYDAADPAPTTKQQVEATNPHTIPCLPSTSVIRLTIDCNNARRLDSKFVRPGAQPANTDIKTYDLGNLYVSTQGQANTTAFGELHVRYKCWLKEQVLEVATVAGGVVHFSGTNGTTANNFATGVLQAGGTPALTGITLGTNTVIFPAGIPGNYYLSIAIAGATSASAYSAPTGGTGVTLFNILGSGGARDAYYSDQSLAGTTTATAMANSCFTIATGGGTVTYSPSTVVGAGTWDLFIVSLPSTVLTVDKPVSLEDVQSLRTQMQSLRDEMRNLRVLNSDSDFENEESCSSSSSTVANGSISKLSNSTVDLIGSLIARKQRSG
jgi:hypothetical protein